jgi:hypothetical protein
MKLPAGTTISGHIAHSAKFAGFNACSLVLSAGFPKGPEHQHQTHFSSIKYPAIRAAARQ